MAKATTFVALLVLSAACLVSAQEEAEVYTLCVYTDENCSENEQCTTDVQVRQCNDLETGDAIDALSAELTCPANVPTGTLYDGNGCDTNAQTTEISGQDVSTGCLIFERATENFFYTVKCNVDEDDAGPDEEPIETDDDDVPEDADGDDEICFSGASSVHLQDGSIKRVDEINTGDMVESYDIRGKQMFSEVFLVQHKDSNRRQAMRRISYTAGSVSGHITVSDLHLVRASVEGDKFVRAAALSEGSVIFVRVNGKDTVEGRVSGVQRVMTTYRNIHTMNDRIVVDGVLASSAADLGPYWMLRAALLPLKGLYRAGLSSVLERCDVALHKLGKLAREQKLLKA
mmetsp:Transcript_10968/g.33649  ORF Transcript_10968/g.33649 Transcript_10968/m.33649 type:complete len:344 (+) Transcript_10968:174-1205(+)